MRNTERDKGIKDAVWTAGEIRKKSEVATGQTALGMSRHEQVPINQKDATRQQDCECWNAQLNLDKMM